MNEKPKQYLVPGLEVTFIAQDKKPHKGKITQVFYQGAARIESLDGNASAIANYSETGEVNTFSLSSASAKTEKHQEAKKET